jgi:hypothetical protein
MNTRIPSADGRFHHAEVEPSADSSEQTKFAAARGRENTASSSVKIELREVASLASTTELLFEAVAVFTDGG